MLTQNRQDSDQVVARAQGVGMLVAQDPTHADESVLTEPAGLLILTQLPLGDSEGYGPQSGYAGDRRPGSGARG